MKGINTSSPLDSELRRRIALPSNLASWLIPIFIFAFTVVVFLPALENGFVNWDDNMLLQQNPNYRGLGWTQLRWMFTTMYMIHYRPLTWMTFGIDYLLWGMNPSGYHLTSLLFHCANAVLFYFVALRLLRLTITIPRAADLPMRLAAGFAALSFSLHPLRVEPVVWASARNDVVSGFFLLLALLCYLRGTTGKEPHPKRWSIAALISYALSLLAKSIGMTFPLVLLILDVYPLKRLGGGSGKWFGPKTRQVWREKVPFFLLALSAGVIALAARYPYGTIKTFGEYGIISVLAQALYGVSLYLWKTIVPLGLSPLYELPTAIGWNWPFLFSGVIVIGITLALLAIRQNWPSGLATWLCYGVMLAPVVLGVAQTGVILADRYSYLSCLGWGVLAGSGLFFCWNLWVSGCMNRSGYLLINGLAVAILLSLGSLTWKQTQFWRDSETLWEHTLTLVPESKIAHIDLGYALIERGELNGAMDHFYRALKVDPDLAEARSGVGQVLAKRGDLKGAVESFRRAVELTPFDAKAQYNLAYALATTGELEEAIHHFRQALDLDPVNAQAHYNLGVALTLLGKLDEATDQFQQALAIEPVNAKAHYSLGVVLTSRGKLEEAIDHLRQALRMEPENAKAREWLARALALQGREDETLKSQHKASPTLK